MKALLVLFTALILCGCQGPMIDYTNPDYNYLAEQPVPTSELVGYWAGMSSSTQENFRINADGTGLYCSEYGVNSSAAAIKVVHKDGKVLLMNAAWFYTLTNGKQPNEKDAVLIPVVGDPGFFPFTRCRKTTYPRTVENRSGSNKPD